MFAAQEVIAAVPFERAAGRLVHLVNRQALHQPSQAAYEDGLSAALRVGPFGGKWGLSKLVQVRMLEPTRRGATLTIPLRWEATGVAGDLFPVLDADLMLAAHGTGQARLALAGCYRPPLGQAGAALDRAVLHRLAQATFRSLLTSVAAAIADPDPDPAPQPRAAPARRRWPAGEPEEA